MSARSHRGVPGPIAAVLRPASIAALAVVLGAGATLAACGSERATEADYVAALAESLGRDAEVPFTAEQIDCLSGRFVDALGGSDDLDAAGISPDELRSSQDLDAFGLTIDEEQIAAMADGFASCEVDLGDLILDAAGEDIAEGVHACVDANLDEGAVARFFAARIVHHRSVAGDEVPTEVVEPLMPCFEPEA